jgi:hypothetical protein
MRLVGFGPVGLSYYLIGGCKNILREKKGGCKSY